jgi:hypothetical protein
MTHTSKNQAIQSSHRKHKLSSLQLQIECNQQLTAKQICFLCQTLFSPKEARVIVCCDRGHNYGELCPHCISTGSDAIWGKLSGWLLGTSSLLQEFDSITQPH